MSMAKTAKTVEMTDVPRLDRENELLRQQVKELEHAVKLRIDEVYRQVGVNNELRMKLKALENQITDAENQSANAEKTLRAFKDAVMLVVKDLAKE